MPICDIQAHQTAAGKLGPLDNQTLADEIGQTAFVQLGIHQPCPVQNRTVQNRSLKLHLRQQQMLCFNADGMTALKRLPWISSSDRKVASVNAVLVGALGRTGGCTTVSAIEIATHYLLTCRAVEKGAPIQLHLHCGCCERNLSSNADAWLQSISWGSTSLLAASALTTPAASPMATALPVTR